MRRAVDRPPASSTFPASVLFALSSLHEHVLYKPSLKLNVDMASGAYDVPGLAYGGIVAVGGLMGALLCTFRTSRITTADAVSPKGYIKAGSVPSLVAGVVSGASDGCALYVVFASLTQIAV